MQIFGGEGGKKLSEVAFQGQDARMCGKEDKSNERWRESFKENKSQVSRTRALSHAWVRTNIAHPCKEAMVF